MKLSELFYECLHADYIHAENGADYALVRAVDALYIYFEASNGATDWKNNLDFPAVRVENGVSLVHRGFLRVFESIREPLAEAILDETLSDIVIVGYSHGGALAVLCYDLACRIRPDLHGNIRGYGFGAPRVYFGIKTRAVRHRFENFTVIRNLDDIVTHLPPRVLGYYHVGRLLAIGEKGKYTAVDAHREENIMRELLLYEEK